MRVCPEPGCPELDCVQHKPRPNQARLNATQRGYDHKWQVKSARYLRHHTLCECEDPKCPCGGACGAGSTETDHRAPVHLFTAYRRAADEDDNLQALCHRCHVNKTVLHDRRVS